MLLFYGEGDTVRVEGDFIGEVYDVISDEVTYAVTGSKGEGMLVRVFKEGSLWGVSVIQLGFEMRIPWPTFLRMGMAGESVVLEVEAPDTVEVKVV